jgi:hypothetical protein
MVSFLEIALFISLGATFVVLALGISTLFRSNKSTFLKSNKLMRLRITLQGLTIGLFILLLLSK